VTESDPSTPAEPTIVGLLVAQGAHDEGQLYTVVIVALAVAPADPHGLPTRIAGATGTRRPPRARGRPPPVGVRCGTTRPRHPRDREPAGLPACAAAGSATLLVPIVGGLAGTTLGVGDSVNVADLVLDVIGPLYVVCGTLPGSAGNPLRARRQHRRTVARRAGGLRRGRPGGRRGCRRRGQRTARSSRAASGPAGGCRRCSAWCPRAPARLTAPAAPPPAGDLPLPPVDSVGDYTAPLGGDLPSLPGGDQSVAPRRPVDVPRDRHPRVRRRRARARRRARPAGDGLAAAGPSAWCAPGYTSWRLARLDDNGLAETSAQAGAQLGLADLARGRAGQLVDHLEALGRGVRAQPAVAGRTCAEPRG